MSSGAASDVPEDEDLPDDDLDWKARFLQAMRWLRWHGYADLADGWNVGKVEHLSPVPTPQEELDAIPGAVLVVAHVLNTLNSIEFVTVAPKGTSGKKHQLHLRHNKPKDLTPDEQKEIVALLHAAHRSMQKSRIHLSAEIHAREKAIQAVSAKLTTMRQTEEGTAGPISGGQFAWDGKKTESLARLQRLLLEALWDQATNRPSPAVSQADVVRAVYGEKADPRDRGVQKKLQNLKARCQKQLDHSGVPLLIDADETTGLWQIKVTS